MKKPSSHFLKTYTISQQRGIFALLIILISVVVYNFVCFNYDDATATSSQFNNSSELVQKVTKQVDSVRKAREEARKTKPKSIKINFISEYNAYKIGFSAEEYDLISNFNKSGNWFNNKEDLAKVLQLENKRLDSINQFLVYPNFQKLKSRFNKKSSMRNAGLPKKDLNLATAEELQKINGVGEVISTRIIKYRLKMRGFRDELQLKEIYGVTFETYNNIIEVFEVKDKNQFSKLNLKTVSVVELSEVPYFTYELSREVKRFIDLREGEVTFDDLLKINEFPTHKLEGIKLYLEIID